MENKDEMVKLDDSSIISVGDMVEFKMKDILYITELKLVCNKVTVGEFKKLLYDEIHIEVYRKTIKGLDI